MMLSYDLTIVGGGMVGLTLAASLAKSDLNIAIIENSEASALSEAPATRVSAISAASRTIFETIGAWQGINEKRITAYDTMYVWEKDSFGKIAFDAQQVDAIQLGYIIENEQIQHALTQTVKKQKNVTFYAPD
ncbi:MAG: NAD(P)-binding protein, partial [Alteromonadales bacterium]|nr:NAD(P)-binding protein [Alteromonadales bacterium]